MKRCLFRRVLRTLKEFKCDPVGTPDVDQAKPLAFAGFNGLNVADRQPADACETCKQRIDVLDIEGEMDGAHVG